jgi:AhpD family alkylhydroperoxidase
MSAPRIAPGSRHDVGLVNWMIARAIGLATRSGPPNLFTTLGRHRGLFRAWLRFAARLMPRGTLPRRDTEIVILRVARNTACEYERRHHVRLGRRAGLTDAEIARAGEDGTDGWSAREAALLRAADELHDDGVLSDALFAELRAHLSETALIELCMLVGHYEMLAMTIKSLGIEPEPEAAR